ncbi:2-C-methyl-D-erythritol 4-phosphate cytidylyltransferase [Hydrobacter penzbergensis]|uniref:2-C-methyl-D-erythritol 4-phosphate cytidylyltransferase n=1 Tax=Hydrobacter penzbergensis TaxID=1235997 RepID=A0A8X8IE63_9BACT|nr:2-C-methyl-D-erythritol 4-phosphate cytidylyltransferase [Hydrobacter penzbergensis]SDX27665.1 2-C-methyl-D-erythritol 4-phosphate cytidylyltransferase [Hydrobacter penzbergensis]
MLSVAGLNMKKYAVIVAGGNGQRMGTEVPKQFLLLKNKPVLWHTIHTFLESYPDMQIILVVPEEHQQAGEKIIADLQASARTTIVHGGSTRFHSVQNGLKKIQEPAVVFVHDGVRCLVSKALIHRCYEAALAHGSAIPAVAATDSIRIAEGTSSKVADRNKVRIVQTPQTFLSEVLLPAFNTPYNEVFTDEATVVEASGKTVHLVQGEHSNIKITRPVDLLIAESIMVDR